MTLAQNDFFSVLPHTSYAITLRSPLRRRRSPSWVFPDLKLFRGECSSANRTANRSSGCEGKSSVVQKPDQAQMINFTGSARTGRKLAALCGKHLKYVHGSKEISANYSTPLGPA